jgi:HlyD family secretion protein
MTARTTVRHLGAASLVLLLAGCTAGEPSAPQTVEVIRTSVTASVTATGSMQAITEQNLGFPDGGELVELNVTVGQQVRPGQVLARVDDFAARQDLGTAQAQLAKEQAALARIRGGNQVDAAEDDVERASEVLEATQEQAEAVEDAGSSAVEQAEKQLRLDEEVLDDTRDRTRADRRSCTDADRRAAEQAAEDAAEDRAEGGAAGGAAGGQGGLLAPLSGQSAQDAQAAQDSACARAAQAEAEVEAAQRQVRASKAALAQAEEQRRVENAQQDLAVENARRDLVAAENEAGGARGDRPHEIDEQAAVVAQMQVEVEKAQRSVDDTVLRAPVAGDVASINGVVGEFLGSGSGTTPLAPGGTVPLPSRSTGVSSSQGLAAGGEQTGGSAFIVLGNVRSFQIVVPFAESDAARVAPNQEVEVTFDAIPDLTRAGTVVSIAPTGTDLQGVISFYATVVLTELDPRLRDGQTVSTAVAVDRRDNALAVPNAALQQRGRTGTVVVQDPDGTQRQVQVELGLEGDSLTEVVAGLHEGQRVVVTTGR